MAHLFDSLSLRSVRLKNRIGVSPMCMYSSQDGFANDFHVVHSGTRSVGGVGLFMTEATAVAATGRITPYDMGIWKDEHVEPLARVVRAIKAGGAVAGIQLAHAGRKASVDRPWGPTANQPLDWSRDGWPVVAPSAIPSTEKSPTPHALNAAEIQAVQAAFVSATQRALAAGYELIEIHGAHGYLAHSFLSPISNSRTDNYGGPFEGRVRFLIETIVKVRAGMPDDVPLAVRLSCTDWTPGGWTPEDSVALSKLLKVVGVDLVDCSSGGNVQSAKIPVAPGFQVPFAEKIRKEADLATAAVGLITDAAQANTIITSGKADMVLLAREMLRNPYFAFQAARSLGKPNAVHLPQQYERAE